MCGTGNICYFFFALQAKSDVPFFDNFKDDKKGFFFLPRSQQRANLGSQKTVIYKMMGFFRYRQSTKPSLQQAVPRSYGRYGGGLSILGR